MVTSLDTTIAMTQHPSNCEISRYSKLMFRIVGLMTLLWQARESGCFVHMRLAVVDVDLCNILYYITP